MQFELAEISLIGAREENQDRMATVADGSTALIAVFDGMGGHSDGAGAAELARKVLLSRFEAVQHPLLDPLSFLHLALGAAHAAMVAMGSNLPLEQRPRATGAVCLVQDSTAWWVHVGDSRIYHLRDGTVARRTEDHTLERRLARAGIRPSIPLPRDPAADRLVHSLGARERPEADIDGITDPRAGDAFLVCSDGLWRHVEGAEIASIVASQPVREAAETLVALARERARGKGDNCSLVLVRLEGAEGEPGSTALSAPPRAP